MIRYVARRVLWVGVLLVVVSFLTFVIFYLFPSADPAVLRAGRSPSPERVEEIRKLLGLDRPWPVQFLDYMKNLVLHFDLGYSFHNDVPVRQAIFERLPATISLAVGALVVWLTAGIGIGVISSNILDKVMVTEPGETFSLAVTAGAGLEYQLENRHYALGLAVDAFLLPQFDAIKALDTRLYLRYTY